MPVPFITLHLLNPCTVVSCKHSILVQVVPTWHHNLLHGIVQTPAYYYNILAYTSQLVLIHKPASLHAVVQYGHHMHCPVTDPAAVMQLAAVIVPTFTPITHLHFTHIGYYFSYSWLVR
jgi:hypothetical protein